MSSLKKFLEVGLDEGETRFAPRLPLPVRDHPLAIAVIASSAIGRCLSGSVRLLTIAADSSVAGRLMRSVRDAWNNTHARARHQSVGVALVVATVVHVLLLWLRGLPPGWLWSIVPAITAAIGAVLILSGQQRSPGTAVGTDR
jgi:hypothetical protein